MQFRPFFSRSQWVEAGKGKIAAFGRVPKERAHLSGICVGLAGLLCYPGNKDMRVVAFIATQILAFDERLYPAELAGPLYPEGIPIKTGLGAGGDHQGRASRRKWSSPPPVCPTVTSNAGGNGWRRRAAKFSMAPVEETLVESARPGIATCAVRTGCGKSEATRRLAEILRGNGKQEVAIRHPKS